jgi:tyrosyl-tRNA synthetase
MSISDDLMWRYFELLSFRPMSEVQGLKQKVEEGLNPRDVKFELCKELVERFHDKTAAEQAHSNFINRFQKGALPDDMPEISLPAGDNGLPIANLLKEAGLTQSTSEAMRMIKQGAVKIDGERVESNTLSFMPGSAHVVQVGKRRFARISIT